MELYIKQRIFTWGDEFDLYDANGKTLYTVEGEVFTFGKKLHLYGLDGNELAYIEQQLLTFLPKYTVYRDDMAVCDVVKEFTFFTQEYTVEGLGWKVTGDFWDHEYSITWDGKTIATVSKEWLTWGDTYSIWVDNDIDAITAVAVVLVIDACIDAQNN